MGRIPKVGISKSENPNRPYENSEPNEVDSRIHQESKFGFWYKFEFFFFNSRFLSSILYFSTLRFDFLQGNFEFLRTFGFNQ